MYAALVRGDLSGTDALAASQQMLQILMDSMATAVFWKDTNSAYLGCNKVFARFAGVDPEVLIGMSDRDMPWADHPEFPADWFLNWDKAVIERGEAELGILEQLRSAKGEFRWLKTNKVPLRDLDGEIIGVLGTFEDVTEHRHAEEELQRTLGELDDRVRQRTQELVQSNQSLRREVEDRMRLQAEEHQQRAYAEALRDTASATANTLDVDEVVEEVVAGVQRLVSNDLVALVLADLDELKLARVLVGFGYDADPEDVRIDELPIIKEVRATGNACILDDPPSGLGSPGSVLGVPMKTADQTVGYLFVESSTPGFFTSRHSERLVAVAALAGAAISNARLAGRVSEIAAAEERQRVARELHDAVNQSLWAAALTAESLVAELPEDLSSAHHKAGRLGALTRGALAEMRSLLLELRPAELPEVPLNELIEHLLSAFEARRAVKVEVDLVPVELGETMHLAFYRIAQEAIGNAQRHSNASTLQVRLSLEPSPTLVVADDGIGFDLDAIAPGHFGMRFMRDRAEVAGLRFSVESELSVGTTITVWSES